MADINVKHCVDFNHESRKCFCTCAILLAYSFLISRYLLVHLIVIFIRITSVVIKRVKGENMEYFNFFCVLLTFQIIFCDAAVPSKFRIADIDMHPRINGKTTTYINNAELTKEYWLENAKKLVTEKLNAIPNTNKAKKVILFVGDGMGLTTTAAARVVIGGEESSLSFEHFPHTASSKTYCLDKGVADSACSATSFLHGVKNNYGTIGLNGFARRSNCEDSNNTRLYTDSIGKWAQDKAMAVGVVTTTRITHATPAGLYANTAERNWETNVEVIASSCDDRQIDDIAEQLVTGEIGSKFKVILGGGSRNFINNNETEHGSKGMRSDGRNLINEWMSKKSSRRFIRTRAELMDLNVNAEEEIFGLFSSDHLPYHLDVEDKKLVEVPSLEEMTMKAIQILDKDQNGYFLLVEGGRIDHSHHSGEAKYALDETLEFSKAIQSAVDSVDLRDTLIVVTSDHSHTMSYAGYAVRKYSNL